MGHLTYSEMQGMGPAAYYGQYSADPYEDQYQRYLRHKTKREQEEHFFQLWVAEEKLRKLTRPKLDWGLKDEQPKARTYAERKAHRRKLVAA